jgi:hypothetical protein
MTMLVALHGERSWSKISADIRDRCDVRYRSERLMKGPRFTKLQQRAMVGQIGPRTRRVGPALSPFRHMCNMPPSRSSAGSVRRAAGSGAECPSADRNATAGGIGVDHLREPIALSRISVAADGISTDGQGQALWDMDAE